MQPLLEVPTIAVDLPGRGDRVSDGTPITIDRCAATVLEDADAAGFARFVLVGHSMGGLTIPRVALHAPDRVAHLVFVGALAPPVGQNVSQALGVDVAPDQPDEAMLPPLPDELCRALFGNDMTDEQWAIAGQGIVAEAAFLFRDPVTGYPTGVPTTYVGMTDDQPVPPALAEQMMQQLGPDVEFVRVEGGHNIMLSQPATLAGILTEIVARHQPDGLT
jgi:pimeloyl-ACP methyl ester carboxylesterase